MGQCYKRASHQAWQLVGLRLANVGKRLVNNGVIKWASATKEHPTKLGNWLG